MRIVLDGGVAIAALQAAVDTRMKLRRVHGNTVPRRILQPLVRMASQAIRLRRSRSRRRKQKCGCNKDQRDGSGSHLIFVKPTVFEAQQHAARHLSWLAPRGLARRYFRLRMYLTRSLT